MNKLLTKRQIKRVEKVIKSDCQISGENFSTEGKTCVIEIMCTRELGDPFRRDALSKPVRFLDKYKDYV